MNLSLNIWSYLFSLKVELLVFRGLYWAVFVFQFSLEDVRGKDSVTNGTDKPNDDKKGWYIQTYTSDSYIFEQSLIF